MRLGMPLTAVIFSMLGAGCPAGDDGDSGAGTDPGTGTGMTDPSSASAPTDPATTDPATTDPATTDPATTDPATTDPATTDPATTDPATTDPATTDPSDTTMDPGTETDPGTTGEPSDPCEITKEDSECDSCVKMMCCDQLTACNEDPECVCFQECAGSMEPSIDVPQICGDQCMIDQPFAHPTVGQVLSCSNGCLLQCL